MCVHGLHVGPRSATWRRRSGRRPLREERGTLIFAVFQCLNCASVRRRYMLFGVSAWFRNFFYYSLRELQKLFVMHSYLCQWFLIAEDSKLENSERRTRLEFGLGVSMGIKTSSLSLDFTLRLSAGRTNRSELGKCVININRCDFSATKIHSVRTGMWLWTRRLWLWKLIQPHHAVHQS